MKVGLWQAIIHDLSKFTPSELPYYQREFFGDNKNRKGFAQAWLHHQNHNPHHWEYWIFFYQGQSGYYDEIMENNCLEMPEKYIREMIADWMGAGKVYEGIWDITNWLNKNYSKMIFHPNTEEKLLLILKEELSWQKSQQQHTQE